MDIEYIQHPQTLITAAGVRYTALDGGSTNRAWYGLSCTGGPFVWITPNMKVFSLPIGRRKDFYVLEDALKGCVGIVIVGGGNGDLGEYLAKFGVNAIVREEKMKDAVDFASVLVKGIGTVLFSSISEDWQDLYNEYTDVVCRGVDVYGGLTVGEVAKR